MATFCGAAGSAFGLRSSAPMVRPIMSAGGIRSLARNTLTTGGPALVGLLFGINTFGNSAELRNLISNAPTYSSEIRAVQREHY